jgi:hypothetical protein
MAANTIEGLRINQWGVEGTKAQGTLTMDTQPTALDTHTIGTKVYTWQASGANADGELNIGADLAAAKVNFVAAVNGTDGINDPHPDVSAAAFATDVCTITARRAGALGDLIATTETFTAVTNIFNATTLGATTAGAYVRGTAVAATSKIAIEELEWGDDDENLYRPQFANGLLIRNRGEATAVQHGTRFSFGDQPMVWEQLPHWLSMAISGAPTVTYVPGSPDVYRWVFDRAPTTNPQPNSFTFQRRFSNGAGDTIDQRAAYAMLSEFELSYATNEHLRMSGAGFARKFETSAITGALSLPTAELGVSALSTVYVNDSWATVGDTLLAEQVIGWGWKFGTGLMPLATAEGRTTLDFTKHQINAGEVMMTLNLTVLLDPTTYATESAHAAAGTRRAVQVKVAGSGGRLLMVDGLFQYTKPSLFKIGEQDGQDIVEIELEEATDQTNFLTVTVDHPTVNSLA